MKNFRQIPNIFFLTAMLFFFNSSFAALNTPSITSPTNNAIKVLNKVTITSNSVTGTTYYLFEIDSVSTFKSGYYKKFSKLTVNNILLDSLPFNKNHFVRVKVFNSGLTDSSAWSSTVKFTTFDYFAVFGANSGYALLSFGWGTNSVAKVEINIDTTMLFNSSCFSTYISETTTTSTYKFKYTKAKQKYYYRYRSRYGSKASEWRYGNVYSNKGFEVLGSTYTDTLVFIKNILLSMNYNGDTNVKLNIWIDTVNTFDSKNLFTTTVSLDHFPFTAKPARNYFMKIIMNFPNGTYGGDSIYKFSMSKNTQPYVYEFLFYKFTIPKGFSKVTIEMDTSVNFNSPLKTSFDSSVTIAVYDQTIYKTYNNIRLYHKMYLRYKVSNPDYYLNWYSTYKLFLMPVSTISVANIAPITSYSNTIYNDQTGLVYEADTSSKFNSKLKIRNYISSAKTDSIKTLKFGKNYFIRFKNFNASKDTTQWGNPFSFKTLDTVRIQSPNGSQYYFNSFNVSSDNVPGVKIYNWQLDTNLDFRTKVDLNSYRNYFTSNEMPRLVVGKKYYWRMRLISLVDTSKWSRIGSINLIPSSDLPYPFLIYPPNNSTNIAPANINFLWKDNTGGIGASYEFYITSPVTPLSIASVATNTIPLKNLMPNTTYTWYVLSYRKNYNSEVPILSQRFTFTTSSISDITGLDKNTTLLVYPNPAYSTLSIQLKTGDKIESLNIRNLEGKLIYEQNFVNSNLFEIDISAFKKGMYIASCQSNRGVYVSKFIKE